MKKIFPIMSHSQTPYHIKLDFQKVHYSDVIMGAMASQFTSIEIVYSTVYSGVVKKTSNLRVTGLCARNSPLTGEFPAQMSSYAENVSILWRHHVTPLSNILSENLNMT